MLIWASTTLTVSDASEQSVLCDFPLVFGELPLYEATQW